VTASGEVFRLERVRLCMEAAEGTEFDLKTLRELAERHRDHPFLSAVCTPEALDLVEPAKQWAVLMVSGLVRTGDFLDRHSRGHVDDVAEAAYEEIDSRRPRSYWLEREDEARDEEASWMLNRHALGDEPVHIGCGIRR